MVVMAALLPAQPSRLGWTLTRPGCRRQSSLDNISCGVRSFPSYWPTVSTCEEVVLLRSERSRRSDSEAFLFWALESLKRLIGVEKAAGSKAGLTPSASSISLATDLGKDCSIGTSSPTFDSWRLVPTD